MPLNPVAAAGRKNRTAAAVIVLLIMTGLVWLAHRESGRPRVLARAEGQVTAPTGQAGAVAWIEKGGSGGDRVMIARRWRGTKQATSGGEITGVALSGRQVLVARWEEGKGGELTAVDLGGGKQRAIAVVKGRTEQIAAADGVVAWLEERPAAIPAAPFVTAAGAVTVVRSVPEQTGQPSIVAVLEVDPLAGRTARADLLGVSGGRIYWLEHHGRGEAATSVIRRGQSTGGAAVTVVSEAGIQEAVLLDGSLAWTCDSPESASSSYARAVKSLSLPEGTSTPSLPDARGRVIGDWLRRDIQLFGSGRTAYVQDTELLWRLGSQRGEQRVLYSGPGNVRTAAVIGDEEYMVQQEGKRSAIAERPLTWWARVRHLLRG
jgi:hypothetical protein